MTERARWVVALILEPGETLMYDGKTLGWRGTLAALALAGSLGATGCSSMANGFGSCCLMNRHEPPLSTEFSRIVNSGDAR